MTSKYEDALHHIKHHYDADMCEEQFQLLDEALRKAESMDRLIEEIDKGFFFTVKVKDKLVEINPVF